MARPAEQARNNAQAIWNGAVVVERTQNGIKHRHPQGGRFMIDSQVGGNWHFGENWQNETDTGWSAAPGSEQPYQMMIGQAPYNALAFPGNDEISAADIVGYRSPATGESVFLTLQALQYINELNQIDQIATPGNISPTNINDSVIEWGGAFGTGIDFRWIANTARLAKQIRINEPGYLPTPGVSGNVDLVAQFYFRVTSGVDIYINGALWNRSPQFVEAISPVEFRSQASGDPLWWFRTPLAWDSQIEQLAARAFYRRVGQNLLVQIRVNYNDLINAVFPVYLDPTIDENVSASLDDSCELGVSNFPTIGTTGLIEDNTRFTGSRWTGITITSGATIDTSYIQKYIYSAGRDDIHGDIWAYDGNNASQFASNNNYIQNLSKIATVVAWDVDSTTEGFQTSPSINTIIQDLVDTYSFSSGVIMLGTQGESSGGTPNYDFYRYDQTGDDTYSGKLHIEYSTGAGDLSASASDSIGVSESVDAEVSTSEINVNDSGSISENVDVEIQTEINVNDSISFAESTEAALSDLEINVNDSIGISESVNAELPDALEISVSDEIALSENSEAAIGVLADRNISVSDSVSIAENIGAETSAPQVSVSDEIAIAENAQAERQEAQTLNASTSDEIAIAESVSAEIPALEVSVSDSISIAENASAAIEGLENRQINVSDTIGLSESVDAQIGDLEISISDTVSISESVDAQTVEAGLIAVSVSDSISISESASAEISTLEISVSETISVSENIDVGEPAAETLEVSVSDAVSVAETISTIVGTSQIAVVDSISIGENIALNVSIIGEFNVSVSDGITISESVTVRKLIGTGVVYVTLHDIDLNLTLKEQTHNDLSLHDIDLTPTLPDQANGDQVTWRDVPIPDDWVWSLPFAIQRNGRSFRVDPNFDLQDYSGITGTTVYVDRAATGANNGTSWADAYTSLWNPLSQAGDMVIYVAKGYYNRNQAWSGINPDGNKIVIGVDDQGAGDAVYITGDCSNQFGSWAQTSNYYYATDGGRTVRSVYDNANLDANGNSSRLTLQASIAAVDASPGSWYQTGGVIYIRTIDDREPDSDIAAYEQGTVCSMQNKDGQSLYVENIVFRGGWIPCYISNASSVGETKFYAKDCIFEHQAERAGEVVYNVVALEGVEEAIFISCQSIGSLYGDGMNYKAKNGIATKVIEVDCISRDHGNSTTDQASTMHDAGSIVRVNGEYYNTRGQVIADVGASASWLLGAYAHDSDTDDYYYCGNAGGKMWLDRCKCDNSGDYDLTAETGATIYIREFLPANYTSSGTIEEY